MVRLGDAVLLDEVTDESSLLAGLLDGVPSGVDVREVDGGEASERGRHHDDLVDGVVGSLVAGAPIREGSDAIVVTDDLAAEDVLSGLEDEGILNESSAEFGYGHGLELIGEGGGSLETGGHLGDEVGEVATECCPALNLVVGHLLPEPVAADDQSRSREVAIIGGVVGASDGIHLPPGTLARCAEVPQASFPERSRVGEGRDGFVVEVVVGHVDLDAHDVEVVEAARGGGTLEAPDGIAGVFIDEGAAAGAGVRSLDGHRPGTLGASNTVPRSTGFAACIGGPSEADTCRPRNPAGAVPGRVAGTVSGGGGADPALAVAGGLLRCFEGREGVDVGRESRDTSSCPRAGEFRSMGSGDWEQLSR